MSKLEGPPLDEQAKNFLRSATDVIQSLFRGNPIFCTEVVREERMAICNSCDKRDEVNTIRS